MSRAGLLAIADFGTQLRRDRARRRRIARRAAALGVLIAAVGCSAIAPPTPRLVWNASASMPRGLYAVRPVARPARGATVIAWAPEPWRLLAARRHYLPANVPLVKQVAAVPGDRICGLGNTVLINGHIAAERARRDGQGRLMPWWNGCRTLRDGDYLLLIPGVAASFDGRYFGSTNASAIVGEARLLWTR